MDSPLSPTERSQLRRHPERAASDPAVLAAILDEALVCHVGTVIDGVPVVMPTMHIRLGHTLYLHGARANRQLQALIGAAECTVSVTLVDGLVFAERAFSHSLNYRSALIFGRAREVQDGAEQRAALAALVERLGRGRSGEAAPPSPAELAGTLVVAVSLAEASVKIRAEGPHAMPAPDPAIWTGVVPLRLTAELPEGPPPSPAALAAVLAHRVVDAHERTRGELLFSSDPQRLDLTRVHDFLRDESYWAAGLDYPTFLRALLGSLCFGVYHGTEQLGFARVVHDGARFGYLADVFIVHEARGRGLGKALVAHVLDHPAVRSLGRVLLGTRDAHGLYAREGWVTAPEGRYMVRTAPVSCAPAPAVPT